VCAMVAMVVNAEPGQASTPLRQSRRLLDAKLSITTTDLPKTSSLARMPSEPATPRRRVPRRILSKTTSDPKEVDVKRRRAPAADLDEDDQPLLKPSDAAKLAAAKVAASPNPVVLPLPVANLSPVAVDERDPQAEVALERHGVPQAGRERLRPLMKHWGPARTNQVMGLWTFLGDGASKPPASVGVQVWGPSGTGKTEIVHRYLQELGIRHVRLNCACFSSLGELQARLAEELRRCAISSLPKGCAVPKELQNKVPPGRQLRALDRIDAAFRPPLEQLAKSSQGGKVIVVLDQSQELARFGPSTAELLLVLPEVLENGGQMTFAFVGRLPLCSAFGVAPANEPPAVSFPPYEADDIEQLLFRLLCAKFKDQMTSTADNKISENDIRALCVCGLVKIAAPYVGHNIGDLMWLGEEVLKSPPAAGSGITALQRQIESLVQQRLGLCDMGNMEDGAEGKDPGEVGAFAILKNNTIEKKRLILAVYLASRIEKEDDLQYFLPQGCRRKQRRHAALLRKKSSAANHPTVPSRLKAPKPVTLSRLLAIYHRVSRQEQLLGPVLLENLVALRESNLIRFADRNFAVEKDSVIMCRVELPLARAIAIELDIDMAEYFGR